MAKKSTAAASARWRASPKGQAWFAATREHRRIHDAAYNAEHREQKAATSKAWRIANKDRKRMTNDNWRKTNPEKAKAARLRERCAKYDITVEAYLAMREAQHGCCAICHQPFKDSRDEHIDHNKQTGKVRGLLCSVHNRALGMFGDTREGLMRAVYYLERTGG